jgi:hypothetical protein
MTTTRRRPRVLALVAAWFVVAALAGASCGGDDDDDARADPTTSESSATSSPPTTLSPEEEAEAVYLELVDVVYRLLTTNPDPDDPDLARLATDPVLGTLIDSVTTARSENHIVQQGPRTSHTVISTSALSPSTVVVRDCSVGNDTTIDQDDGSVVSQGLSTRLLEATVLLTPDGWKVSDVGTVELFDGEVACPE